MKRAILLLALLAGCYQQPKPPPFVFPTCSVEPLTVEIFEAGDYPLFGERQRITTAHIDQMVHNFYLLKRKGWKVPLKFGHGPQQLIGGIQGKQGDPALGWVENVERRGTKFIAHVEGIPCLVRELMARNRYRRVSMEWLVDWEHLSWEWNMRTGARGSVLEAVALLGADIPMVQSLNDLAYYLSGKR